MATRNIVGRIGFWLSLVGAIGVFLVGTLGPVMAIVGMCMAFLCVPGIVASIVGLFGRPRRLAAWGVALGIFALLYLPTFYLSLRPLEPELMGGPELAIGGNATRSAGWSEGIGAMLKVNGYESTNEPRLSESSTWAGSQWYIRPIGNIGAVYVAVQRDDHGFAAKIHWTQETHQVSDAQQIGQECDRIGLAVYMWWDGSISDQSESIRLYRKRARDRARGTKDLRRISQGPRWPSQEVLVETGYATIPQAKQIDDLVGPAWHFMSNYRRPNVAEWCTEALFAGRYELHMRVPVEIDRSTGDMTVLDDPRFQLMEVTRVEDRSIHCSDDYHEFGVQEWDKVANSDGDFSVIGIHLDQDHPVPGFARYKQRPRNGIQMKSVD